jgi:5-methylcytosine-specific restriction endonuclease McrA
MKKICSKCLIEKDFCDFHKHKGTNDGYYTICKICRKPISEKYFKENKELINIRRSKKYYENHEENLIKDRERIKNEREKRLESSKIYYVVNKDKVKEYQKKHYELNKENYIKRAKVWRDNNKERSNLLINVRNKIRKKEDVLFKLKTKLKTDIYISLKRKKKSKTLEQIIGLSLTEYKKHIENQFEDWMSWDNWGLHTWHIDHIIPLSSAKTEEEVYLLWNYTNLRPLSANENLKKGNKF